VTVEDFLLTMLPLNYILICVRLRFPAAAAFLAICFAIFALAIFGRRDLTTHAQIFLLGFMAAFCLPALIGAYGLERASRRLYLHALMERLRNEHLTAENSTLADLSVTDALTGVGNRRRLDAELETFCAAGKPGGALLLIDIDHFKAFNDRYGHPAGDRCLREVASCLSLNLRRRDLVARFGGEEFAVVLADMTDGEALETANRLRKSVAAQIFDVEGEPVTVTVSIGLAEATGQTSPTHLVAAADAALYAAKRAGRDQVCVADPDRPGLLERPNLERL
jgi:diguanylate cyclase (GGDEF)-like protein